jgi:DNA polymerase
MGCTRCPLFRVGTQTVFGEGPSDASVVLVGEQPGDKEDIEGRPFVGPAGRVLDQALAAAGVDRESVYVTNAVKHFKNVPRGKRRIHQKPNANEIDRCKWWLDLELAIIKPRLVVALGATAARSLLGRPTRIETARSQKLTLPDGLAVLVTVHPAMLVRIRDRTDRARQMARFVADLALIPRFVPSARNHAVSRNATTAV